MKDNSLAYELFAAAIIGMFLIFGLCACTDDEPTEPDTFIFTSKSDADTLETMYYFQFSAGDSIAPSGIVVADTIILCGEYGKLPQNLTADALPYRYGQMFAFYIDGSRHFVPCCLFARFGDAQLYGKCTNGITSAFELNQ